MTTPAVNVYYTVPGYVEVWRRDWFCGTWHLLSTSPTQNYSYSESRPASTNSPKAASGWRQPTNWTHFKSEGPLLTHGIRYSSGVICSDDGLADGYRSGDVTTTYDPYYLVGGPPSWMSDVAATKAYMKLKNQNVNLSVAFAERKETERLFTSNVESIAKQVKRFRGGAEKLFRKAASVEGTRLWKQTPEKWLELQYGWNPLMQDVLGACKALDEKSNDRYYARCEGSVNYTENYFHDIGDSASKFRYVIDNKHSVRIILYYRMDNPLLASLSSLGITNPAELAWERLKYSFVIDWFLPIGNWLSSWDADFGWAYKSGTRTEFTKATAKASLIWEDSFTKDFTTVKPYSGFRMNRYVLTVPPGIGVPHFKNPLSGKHIANAMSLLVQAFR